MTTYKALVKDKVTKKYVTIESDYESKTAFIQDLRGNGYAVNPYKVKEKSIFDKIVNETNCSIWNWKEEK